MKTRQKAGGGADKATSGLSELSRELRTPVRNNVEWEYMQLKDMVKEPGFFLVGWKLG